MKYYSEILTKFYDDPDKLLSDESLHLDRIAAEEEALEQKKASQSARKKELANAIEKCDEELDAAYKKLNDVKLECKDIIKKVDEEVNSMLSPAEEAVKKAQAARLDAIRAFNKEFGVFKTTYTAERANREMQRTADMFDKMFRSLSWFI